MKKTTYFILAAWIVAAFPGLYGQSADPRTALQQALKDHFVLTTLSNGGHDIQTPGSVLVLQKDGFVMYTVDSPLPPLCTYKNGKMSKSFSRDLEISMRLGGNATTASLPQRKFGAGDKFWISGGTISKDGMVLRLYSDPYDDVRYYGELKFPFDKSVIPTSDDALAKIAEVLTIQPEDNAAGNTPAPADTAPPPPAPGILQNADIVKMAKAGLDDSIIIAKIKSSKCQFDTSPDALIDLKQNGISTAVMRAMTGASNRP